MGFIQDYNRVMRGPQPDGTEGIVSVKITTTDQDANTLDMKGCIVKDDCQYKVLLPDVKCPKENIKEIEAEFYHFRKGRSFPLKFGKHLHDIVEQKHNHQFVTIDLKKKTPTRRRRFRKMIWKTESETVQSYVEKRCKLKMDHVNKSDRFNLKNSLFGVKNSTSEVRAEFVELKFSEDRELESDEIKKLLHPNGPLFHVFKTRRNDQDEYEVEVVGSYSVQDRKISFVLFVEDDQGSADRNSNSSPAIHRDRNQDEYKVEVVGRFPVQDCKVSIELFVKDDQGSADRNSNSSAAILQDRNDNSSADRNSNSSSDIHRDKNDAEVSSADRNSNSSAAIHRDKNVELYSKTLKESITKRTAVLPRGIDLPRLKTQEIFTNLTVYQSKQKSVPQKDQKDRRACSSGKTVKECSEIFVAENGEERPKSILVSGEPGIGKTLFCYKILRDWSENCIQIPDIQVAYLIQFRQLIQLGDEKHTLSELLNRSPLINEKSQMSQTILESIVDHPEQLLIVLDGFDEYKDNNNMLHEDFEILFPNDVFETMPVAALVSKLIQKKIMSESVTMVTSRPGEADKLDKKFDFDKYVDITGFSETQILEYVEKFFSSKPKKVKEMAVEKIKETAHCMTFAQVPLMCFLLCVVIGFDIENNLTKNYSNSLTLTQFYSEIILSLEENNKEMRNLDEEATLLAVKKTLDSLARIAAELLERSRFTFTLEDIKMLNLSKKEMMYLQNSNLIVCYPVANNSPFSKTSLEYGFAHSTIQEFLAARHCVKMDAMAAVQHTSEMFYTFVSGLLGLDKEKNNDELMLKVLEGVSKQVEGKDRRRRVVLLRCLYEYGQEKELTRKQLTENPGYKYWGKNGWIRLYGVTNSDCDGVAMLVNKSSAASQLHTLYIVFSSLSYSGLNSILPALTKPDSTITELVLWLCQLDDKCVHCLCEHLTNTNVTKLNLTSNKITDNGLQYLMDNWPTNLTSLDLTSNKITDNGLQYLMDNLPTNLIRLELNNNNITDNGLQYLMDNWPTNLTDLDLGGNNITDNGLQYLMDNRPTNLTYLNLFGNPLSKECKDRAVQFFKENYTGLYFFI